MSAQSPIEDPRFTAAIDMLRRTGLSEFEVRYSEDPEPVVWMAVGTWHVADGRPVPEAQGVAVSHEATAALDPLQAVLRLLDQVIDGGQCAHCGRPSGLTEVWPQSKPLSRMVCWIAYDPKAKRYRRSCE